METSKSEIIANLRREILPLEGLSCVNSGSGPQISLGPINEAFPGKIFPTAAMHEFICSGPENSSASAGFIAVLIGALMKPGSVAIWVGLDRLLFPPALSSFGIDPERVIFIQLRKEKQIPWVMEEALKCAGIAAVVGEIPDIGFTSSRRFQLAVEKSAVTGFLIRRNPRSLATACVSRWRINPIPSSLPGNMPGVGFPSWSVELIKIRNGRTGSWRVEYQPGGLRDLSAGSEPLISEIEKTGSYG